MQRVSRQAVTRVVCAALLFASLAGCQVAVPFIDSFKQIGATEGDRVQLLAKSIKQFQDARYWDDQTVAMNFFLPDKRMELLQTLRRKQKDERIIESKVDDVTFTDDSKSAEVNVLVRSYKVPYYVVNERTERQTWKFSLSQGWQLEALGAAPLDNPAGIRG